MMSLYDNEENDPFFYLNQVGQSKRYRAYIQVLIGSNLDVTDRLNPYLVSVLVVDGGVWEATIELDDRDGSLPIPPLDASLTISMGWTSENSYKVFEGYVNDVEHGFGRKQGGRRMWVYGRGMDASSAIKSPFSDHIGEGAPPGEQQGDPISFTQAAQQFGANAGITVDVGPTFAGTMRDYWSMNNESILEWTARHAEQFGAWHRVEGQTIIFNGVNDFEKPRIIAQWGSNLIGWKLRPYVAQATWKGSHAEYYDHQQAMWTTLLKSFNLNGPWGAANAIHRLPVPAPNANVAQQLTDGDQEKSYWMSGDGRIIINGEPQASFGGTVQLTGARPGVDGDFFILAATHTWSRQGYVTIMDVQPDTDAPSNNIGSQGYTLPTPFQQALPTSVTQPADHGAVLSIVATGNGIITTTYSDGTVTTLTNIGTTTISPDGNETFVPQ